jgi:hypothetical protein
MTHREIQTAELLMESRFHNGGAWALDRAATLDLCPQILGYTGKDTQTHPLHDLSKIQFRRSGERYPIPYAALARDYVQQDCKPDSIPI